MVYASQIIWAKDRLVLEPRSDYHWQHEPMLVWLARRKSVQGPLVRRDRKQGHALADRQQARSRMRTRCTATHEAGQNVCERPILNNSSPGQGDLVYEPFMRLAVPR